MPLAIVYNDFLCELGGGERSTLSYAKALQELGYETEVACSGAIPSRATLTAYFGDEFSTIPVRSRTRDELTHLDSLKDLAIFVNHTFMSMLANRAPIGIYVQMFPVRELQHPSELSAIGTYHLILSNSHFTDAYTRRRWRNSGTQMAVLWPPIGTDHTLTAQRVAVSLPPKSRLIVHIGRFNPSFHDKNQLLIIETFLEVLQKHCDLEDWHLVLAGTVTADARSQRLFDQCRALASSSGGCITVKPSISSKERNLLLSQAFGYVHATGAFLPPGLAPERCEHFGLAILEAMAHGCVPLVYGRGGIWEVASGNRGVLSFLTRSELVDGYKHLAALYGSDAAHTLGRGNAAQAASLGFDAFKGRLAMLLGVNEA